MSRFALRTANTRYDPGVMAALVRGSKDAYAYGVLEEFWCSVFGGILIDGKAPRDACRAARVELDI